MLPPSRLRYDVRLPTKAAGDGVHPDIFVIARPEFIQKFGAFDDAATIPGGQLAEIGFCHLLASVLKVSLNFRVPDL